MSQIEKGCKWNFAQRNGGIDQGPNDAMGDTFKKLPYDALVRESIQNSLDAAKDDTTPVVVTFKRSSFEPTKYPELFKLRKHIQACLDFYNTDDCRKRFEPMLQCLDDAESANKLHYLEVSDENTKGMPYKKGSTSSPFYAFVKSIGNSVKENKAKGGSKGYGKAAYFNASKIRTILISSLTEQGEYVFEGVTGLCTHVINGNKCEHYGFYTDSIKSGAEEPITIQDNIPHRFCRKSVGTSAFILGVDYGPKGTVRMKKLIVESVITNFWAAILDHKLEVKIVVDQAYEINADNIFQWAEQCFDSPDDTKTYFSNPRPYMDAFLNVDKDFNHKKYEKEMPVLGKVELYLTRTKTGTDTFICMRSPLMMVKSTRNRTNYGFYGVFICRDEKGNEVLRSMEEGSHTQWDYKNCSSKQDREKAKLAEDEIKAFLDECIADMFHNGTTTTLTFGGLEEFLTIPSSLEDEENFGAEHESDKGEANGGRTDSENSETTTEIDDEEDGVVGSHGDSGGAIGQVVIIEGTSGTPSDDGGEMPGGDGPAPGDNGNNGGDNGGSGGSGGGSGNGGNGGSHVGGGVTEIPGYNPGDGQPMRRTKLNVRYRAFAQTCSGGGYSHRLVITSNRDSESAIVQVMCAGETSNEAIAIKKADQGSWSGNIISDVKLTAGRNVINIWFDDDMRHSITLTVHEN